MKFVTSSTCIFTSYSHCSHNAFLLLPPLVFSPRPQSILRHKNLLQPQPWRVDRARSCVDEHIIQEPSERTPKKRRHHRNPEIIPASRPDLWPIAHSVAHEPWPEVSRNVDCVACLPAETRSEPEDEEEQAQWEPFVGFGNSVVAKNLSIRRARRSMLFILPWVFEREDDKHQQRTRNELAKELTRLGHEALRVRAEDTCCCIRRWRDSA